VRDVHIMMRIIDVVPPCKDGLVWRLSSLHRRDVFQMGDVDVIGVTAGMG
jgi:hypothetical protein